MQTVPSSMNVANAMGVDYTSTISGYISQAFLHKEEIYWDWGTFNLTSSIPHFQEVRHRGPGVVQRGSKLFYPDPSFGKSNIIYCNASTGLDTNDGIDPSSSPLREIRTAVNLLKNYGPALDGTWEIRATAGSYKGGITVPRGTVSRGVPGDLASGSNVGGAIRITGTKDGSGIPTTIVDQSLDPTASNGFFGENFVRVIIEDIKIIGSFDAATYFRNQSYVKVSNVHVVGGAAVGGVRPSKGHQRNDLTKSEYSGGIIDNCARGIEELFLCSGNITADPVTIQNCDYGFDRKELCTGHLDSLVVQDCTLGVTLGGYSNQNVGGMTLKRNTLGISLAHSEIHESEDIVWGTGADANTVRINSYNGIVLESNGWTGDQIAVKTGKQMNGSIAQSFEMAKVQTGFTTETEIKHWTGILDHGVFSSEGATVEVRVEGFLNNTLAGTARIILRFGSSLGGANFMTDITIPSTTPSGSRFFITFETICVQDGARQVTYARGSCGSVTLPANRAIDTVPMDTTGQGVYLSSVLTNAADSITIDSIRIFG